MNENITNVILNSLAEGVITVDKEFKITFINEAAENLTGFKGNEVLGKFCKNVFKSEFCLSNCPIARVLQNGKSVFDLDTEIECANTNPIPIRLNAAVLKDQHDNPAGGVITFRDISIFKKAEELVRDDSHFYGMVGKTKAMKEIFKLIKEISDSDASVIVMGETGTGKELVANAIQATSKRKNKKFIKVNCSVIPHHLLASELFGHSKGAFTDAKSERIGRFEYAGGGTIFLDEIIDMPLPMQPQLLRILQEGTFERLGETISRSVDVRVISATNTNIEKSIKENRFRDDLYYRLSVIPIELPPLKKRKEDIPFLIDFFLKKHRLIYKKNIPEIDENYLESLMNWHWPGNIRELENTIEYSVIRAKNDKSLCICTLPKKLRGSFACNKNNALEIEQEINSSYLIELLNQHKWNKTKVANLLGIDRTTLWRKLKAVGLN
jgi:PAS domain S-box-containing protein